MPTSTTSAIPSSLLPLPISLPQYDLPQASHATTTSSIQQQQNMLSMQNLAPSQASLPMTLPVNFPQYATTSSQPALSTWSDGGQLQQLQNAISTQQLFQQQLVPPQPNFAQEPLLSRSQPVQPQYTVQQQVAQPESVRPQFSSPQRMPSPTPIYPDGLGELEMRGRATALREDVWLMRQRIRTLGVDGIGGRSAAEVLRYETQGLMDDVAKMWQELGEVCSRCGHNHPQQ
jgi:hypothetical protein